MPRLKACRKCKILTEQNKCQVCDGEDLSINWEGVVVIVDPTRSELAKRLGISRSGAYALRVI